MKPVENKKPKKTHPWRVWIPKKDRPENEPSRQERIPVGARMGVRL